MHWNKHLTLKTGGHTIKPEILTLHTGSHSRKSRTQQAGHSGMKKKDTGKNKL